jgi:hypothetical protein
MKKPIPLQSPQFTAIPYAPELTEMVFVVPMNLTF